MSEFTRPTAEQLENLEGRFLQAKQEIYQQCRNDPDFRQRLLDDPRSTIEDYYGLPTDCLAHIDINVIEEGPSSIVVPIPADEGNLELTDEQMEEISAGFWGIFAGFGLLAGTIAGVGLYKKSQGDSDGW